MSKITLVTLNIEEDRHLAAIKSFFKDQNPDIICLQEAMEADVSTMADELDYQFAFAPIHDIDKDTDNRKGIAILCRGEIKNPETTYYGSFLPGERKIIIDPKITIPIHCPLLFAQCEVGGQAYPVTTTHFAWSPDGSVSDHQRRNMERLIHTLQRYPEIILCGDFNTPRGKEAYDSLAQRYKDNLPASVATTIDPNLHKAGPLQWVVDTIFTSPQFKVENVHLVDGLSDHCAVIGTVLRP